MKVCICYNVSDKEIIQAIKSGSSTTNLLMQQLKVGTCCRQCLPDINRMVEEYTSQLDSAVLEQNPIIYTPIQA